MIICVCNNLNDKKIKEAIDHNRKNCVEILEFHGCSFRCKKCIPSLHEIKRAHKK